jgi:hypothetical protein
MKLKNIFMYVAATTVLFSCSDNEPVLDKEEKPAPATLSIRIDADGTIISKADVTDQTISNLYVLIFDADGAFYKAAELDLGEESDDQVTEGDPTTAENVDIEVKEGAHQVLVIANFKGETSDFTGKTLSEVQAMTTKLDAETDGNLTMSSRVMPVTFLGAVKNTIGYSPVPTGAVNAYPSLTEPVKLYRSVARIQLSQVILGGSVDETAYGKPVAFWLDEIFVANAKGYSRLASTDNETLSIEAKGDDIATDLWWYGDWSEYNAKDVLKKIVAEKTNEWKAGLCYTENGRTIWVNVDQPSWPETVAAPAVPLMKDFYVYENEEADPGYQTLLILKGEYQYERAAGPIFADDTPLGDNVYAAQNRYYAIPVNTAGMEATADEVLRDHEGIIRNTIYDLRVTITGPGSTSPYQPDAHLYYNAQVTVADWTRVNIGTPTDPQEIN